MSAGARGDRRVAVVTGGGGAIGGAIAARLEPDHNVVLLDGVRDLGVELGDPAGARRAAQIVLERCGRCDVFVHAEAMAAFEPFHEFRLDVWRQVQTVNVESALLLAQAFAPGMQARGFGPVIFIVSDTCGRAPRAHALAYIASAGAPVGVAHRQTGGFGADGMALTVAAPARTRTPATVNVSGYEFADTSADQASPRPLTPDDTATVVAMLVGDNAAALTGQTLSVDGGTCSGNTRVDFRSGTSKTTIRRQSRRKRMKITIVGLRNVRGGLGQAWERAVERIFGVGEPGLGPFTYRTAPPELL